MARTIRLTRKRYDSYPSGTTSPQRAGFEAPQANRVHSTVVHQTQIHTDKQIKISRYPMNLHCNGDLLIILSVAFANLHTNITYT